MSIVYWFNLKDDMFGDIFVGIYSLRQRSFNKRRSIAFLACVFGIVLIYCITGFAYESSSIKLASNSAIEISNNTQVGIASWYGRRFHGRRTSSGQRYNMYKLTAAHRRLPLGSVVKVTNLSNGREVTVRINDRGPYARGRVIDLSYAAAKRLNMVRKGITKVRIELISPRYKTL